MARIKIIIDPNQIRIRDLRKMTSASVDWDFIAEFIARFAVDEEGKPLGSKDAIALVDDLTIAEANEIISQAAEAVSNSALPLAKSEP